MAVEQAVSTGLEALKLIVSGGIGAAIIGIIGKVFVDRKLQEQKAEHDKQLESLKSELGKKDTVHKLQFAEEFKLYNELWKKLIVVRKTVLTTSTIKTVDEQSSVDSYDEAVEAFNAAMNLFEDHRPFYHDSVSRITKDLLSQCRGFISDAGKMLKSENFDYELEDKADELLEKIPEAIDEIEKVIKGRIGLLQKAEIVE